MPVLYRSCMYGVGFVLTRPYVMPVFCLALFLFLLGVTKNRYEAKLRKVTVLQPSTRLYAAFICPRSLAPPFDCVEKQVFVTMVAATTTQSSIMMRAAFLDNSLSSSSSNRPPLPHFPSYSPDCNTTTSGYMDWFRCWMTILQYSFNKKNPTRIEKQLRKKDHTEFPPQVEPVAIQHDDDDDDDVSSREPNHSQPRSWLRLSFSSDTSLNSHYGTDTTNTRALRQSRHALSSTMTVVIPNCPAGEYWMEHQVDNEDGFNSLNHGSTSIVGKCQSVGLGYYSPQEDGQRYPCPVGTFSDVTQADVCQECLPLYYNGLGSDYAVTLTPDTNGAPMEGLFCLQPLVAPVEVSFLDNLDTGIDGDESFSSLELDDEEGTIFSTPSEFPSSIPPTALTPTPSPTFNDDVFTLTPTWTSTSSLYPPTISPLPTLTPASNDYITASPSPTTTNVANSMPYRNSNNSMAKDDDSNVKGGTFFSTPKRKVFSRVTGCGCDGLGMGCLFQALYSSFWGWSILPSSPSSRFSSVVK